MINDTFEALRQQAVRPRAPQKDEGVGTDDDREPALSRQRAQGFDRQINPSDVVEGAPRRKPSKDPDICSCSKPERYEARVSNHRARYCAACHKILPNRVNEAVSMRPRRPGGDPSNARGHSIPKMPSLKNPFKPSRMSAGSQFQLRPRLRHGKFAIHGPGDLSPKFRFHNERIATLVADLLQRHTKKPHQIIQNDFAPAARPFFSGMH